MRRQTVKSWPSKVMSGTSLGLLIHAASVIGLASSVTAQTTAYPQKQIRVVVPFPAGGSADYFARTVFNKIGPELGQPIVTENIAGAGGVAGTRIVIKAAPDGHTLLVSAVASALIAPSLVTPPAFVALKDLTPITGIGTVPAVLVVKPALGLKTFESFIKHLKANPGKINMATSGNGTISHLTGVLLMREAGVNIVPVHYRGAPPAVNDLVGGHIDMMISDAPFFLSHVKADKLTPLAVGTPSRAPALPSVPTTGELGFPKLLASNTYSLFGPAGMPKPIVDKLNQLVRKALEDGDVKANFAKQAATPAGDTPENFRAMIEAEADRWLPLVRDSGLIRK